MKPFVRTQIETYRKSQPTNQWEDDDKEEDVEIQIRDALISVYDIQMITDVNADKRIAVMLTDGSLVSVVSTIEEFTKLMDECQKSI